MKILALTFLCFLPFIAFSNDHGDTLIAVNQNLIIKYEVSNIIECGLKIHKEPKHSIKSQITLDRKKRIYLYEYQPKLDYIGNDTLVLIKGCFVNGEISRTVADTLVYHITIISTEDFRKVSFDKTCYIEQFYSKILNLKKKLVNYN